MNLNTGPLTREIYEICLQHENYPAGVEQTALCVRLGAFASKVEAAEKELLKRWPPIRVGEDGEQELRPVKPANAETKLSESPNSEKSLGATTEMSAAGEMPFWHEVEDSNVTPTQEAKDAALYVRPDLKSLTGHHGVIVRHIAAVTIQVMANKQTIEVVRSLRSKVSSLEQEKAYAVEMWDRTVGELQKVGFVVTDLHTKLKALEQENERLKSGGIAIFQSVFIRELKAERLALLAQVEELKKQLANIAET